MGESLLKLDNCWLNRCACNVTSPRGEDGIMARALEVIGVNDRSGCRKLVWHGVDYDPRRVQQLPFWLRKFPPSIGRIRLACLELFRKIRKG